MTVTPKDSHVLCSGSTCCSPKGLEPHISHSIALTSSPQDSAPSLLAPPPPVSYPPSLLRAARELSWAPHLSALGGFCIKVWSLVFRM